MRLRPVRGFTLLEVLVALVVASVALAGLMRALGEHLKTASWAESRSRALSIARREMTLLRELPTASPEENTGEEGLYRWETRVEETEILAEESFPNAGQRALRPLQLEVIVEWSAFEGGPTVGRLSLTGIHLFRN